MGIVEYVLHHRTEVGLYLGLLFVSWKAIVYYRRLFLHPLSGIPGPKVAAASRLYEFYWDCIQHGRLWAQLPQLHEQYGPIIRLTPEEVHIGDSTYFDTLFGFNTNLVRDAMTAKQYGMKHALFATEDYKTWSRKRAAFGDAFSRTKALQLKDMMTERIDRACDWMRERMARDGQVNMAYVFRATPAEIATQFLFGEDYGFLEDEQTTLGFCDKSYDTFFGMTHLGRFIPFWIPLLASLLRQKAKGLLGFKEPGAAWLTFYNFTQKLVLKTQAKVQEGTLSSSELDHAVTFEAFLNHKALYDSERTLPVLSEHAITIWSGGWENVGFSLTAGAYAIVRDQKVLERLQQELISVWPNPETPPPLSALDQLPYLNAVLKEVFRITPGALCRLTRINPTEPTQYKGYTIPAGTKISMSLPMIVDDPAIWGEDHAVFRPERWLEDGADELEKYLATFSKGTRVCPGIELTWVEFRLIVGTMFRRFDMKIPADSDLRDEDIYPYYEGFTPMSKPKKHFLPMEVIPLK